MKHRCDIWKVAEQCGVKLCDPSRHGWSARRPRECYAKKTLKKIGQRYGEAHLALTLRLIVETNGNSTELYSETIHAISALLANPAVEARGGELFDLFDNIQLADIRRQAKALAIGLPLAHVMRVLLATTLHSMPADGRLRASGSAA